MKKMMLIAVLAIPVLATGVAALDSADGSTVTELFEQADALGGMAYPSGYAGIEWEDLAGEKHLGTDTWNLEVPVLAVNGDGDVYVRIAGGNLDGNSYTGVFRYDGSSFTHLVQDVLVNANSSSEFGSRVEALAVSPATTGKLTAGRPVIARYVRDTSGDLSTDIVSLDDSQSPVSERLVWTFDEWVYRLGVDSTGRIYCQLETGDIHRLTWSGSSYSESTFATGVGLAMALGPDDAVYTFPTGTSWGGGKGENDLLRIDPSTGQSSVYATVKQKYRFGGLAIDGTGQVWMGLGETSRRSRAGFVVAVEAGAEASSGQRAAQSGHQTRLRGLAGGPSGDVYVLEKTGFSDSDPVSLFAATLGTDSGGGGGGKGGGKGKNK